MVEVAVTTATTAFAITRTSSTAERVRSTKVRVRTAVVMSVPFLLWW
jgi:hypothetical protein